jgi:hypothetical protein
MKRPILLSLFTIATLTGCENIDVAPGTPECLIEKIKSLEKTSICDNGASVKAYKFQDKTVYVLSDGHCYADSGTEVIDSDCRPLGTLGGLAGRREIKGVEFYSNAVLIRTIWEN